MKIADLQIKSSLLDEMYVISFQWDVFGLKIINIDDNCRYFYAKFIWF